MRQLVAIWLVILLAWTPGYAQTVIITPNQFTALDDLETLLTAVGTNTDGLEALVTTQAGYLDGVEGFLDGLEGLLTTQAGYLDGLEGFVDGLEALLSGTLVVNSELAASAALADNFANPTTAPIYALAGIWDGSTWDRWTGAVTVTGTVTVGSHAVTNAGTFAVQESGAVLTALQLIDNLVSVEDAVAGSGFSGIGFLAVRQDSQTGLAADGDFIPPTIDSVGGLRVSIVAGAGSGGTAQVDDADFTDSTTSGTPIGGVAESAAPSTVTEGDFGWAAITLNRALKVALYGADGTAWTQAVDVVEDAAETAGGTGPMVMSVRRDTAASSAGTTGDNATLNTDASGRLWVNCGTGCAGGTQFAEDLAHITADVGTIALAIRDDTLNATSSVEGKYELLHTNANGALWAIDVNSAAALTALQLLDNAISGAGFNITQFNGAAVPIGAGTEAAALRVTLATDSTGVVSIDDNGGSLTVDGTVAVSGTVTVAAHAVTNAGTFVTQIDGAALTALQLIDNAIFADDAAFTLASSSVTMAGAIRDDSLSALAAIEGDAVVLRVNSTGALHVTGGGGGTEFAEDTAHSTGAMGSLPFAVRNDAGTALAGTTGDYIPLMVNASGALYVTGGGGGTEYVVNAVAPADPAGATFTMERDDVLSALAEIEGDWTNPRSNANGALWTTIDGTVTVAAHAVTNAGTFVVQENGAALTALQLIDNAISGAGFNITQFNGAAVPIGAGTEAAALRVTLATDSTGLISVDDNGGSLTVDGTVATTNAGTFAVQESGAALTALQLIDNAISGTGFNVSQINGVAPLMGNGVTGTGSQRVTIASDNTAFSVNAVQSGTWNVGTLTTLSQLGGVALPVEDVAETAAGVGIYAMGVRRDTIASSAGTAGDNTMSSYDSLGRMWVRPASPCADHARVTDVAINTATAGNVELVALNGSDVFYVCGFNFLSTAAQSVQLISGTGTACATGETDETGPYAFAANAGIAIPNTGAVQFTTAAGAALCIELSAATQVSGLLTYVRTAAP